jgi:hypothetical protein
MLTVVHVARLILPKKGINEKGIIFKSLSLVLCLLLSSGSFFGCSLFRLSLASLQTIYIGEIEFETCVYLDMEAKQNQRMDARMYCKNNDCCIAAAQLLEGGKKVREIRNSQNASGKEDLSISKYYHNFQNYRS